MDHYGVVRLGFKGRSATFQFTSGPVRCIRSTGGTCINTGQQLSWFPGTLRPCPLPHQHPCLTFGLPSSGHGLFPHKPFTLSPNLISPQPQMPVPCQNLSRFHGAILSQRLQCCSELAPCLHLQGSSHSWLKDEVYGKGAG